MRCLLLDQVIFKYFFFHRKHAAVYVIISNNDTIMLRKSEKHPSLSLYGKILKSWYSFFITKVIFFSYIYGATKMFSKTESSAVCLTTCFLETLFILFQWTVNKVALVCLPFLPL